jgi:SAM-dependent methyltransferase
MNSSERLRNHRAILESKPAFSQIANDIHQMILNKIEDLCGEVKSKQIIEIGAGVIPLSSLSKHTISTDIETSDGLDLIASATSMPFKSSSVRAVVAQNVFHHIPHPDKAMSEFSRILDDGGIVVLVEPYFGRFASFVYPALFSSEGYDKSLGFDEKLFDSHGDELPNQAISYTYFSAGEIGVMKNFPNMEIVFAKPMRSGLRYLLSGALNFRKLVPSPLLGLLRFIEARRSIGWVLNIFAIHWVIVIRPKDK